MGDTTVDITAGRAFLFGPPSTPGRRTSGTSKAYWSSPTHDFVPFLIGVKDKYDPKDLSKFAQSIPRAL